MRIALIALLLSGCSCNPWFPPPPMELMQTQSASNSLTEEIPELGIGMKCRY